MLHVSRGHWEKECAYSTHLYSQDLEVRTVKREDFQQRYCLECINVTNSAMNSDGAWSLTAGPGE